MGLTAAAERRTSPREQEVKKSLDLTTLVTCASWWVEEGGAVAVGGGLVNDGVTVLST